jgi:hypothetical protein
VTKRSRLYWCVPFDNSSNHGFTLRTHCAQNMNMGPGGKQPIRRPGILPGRGKQQMQFPDDYHDESLRRKPKGIKLALEERNLWQPHWMSQCASGCSNSDDCCERWCLFQQPDFKEQKGWIQETIEARGHKVLFYSNSTGSSISGRPSKFIPESTATIHSKASRMLFREL